jgi:hypothetical protein
MLITELFKKPEIIALVGDVNEAKSNLIYYLLNKLKGEGSFKLYTYGLRYNIEGATQIYTVVELENIKDSLVIIERGRTFSFTSSTIFMPLSNARRRFFADQGECMLLETMQELTPVEEYDGIQYKRDDTFLPFRDIPVNGGKLRQCLTLLYNAERAIKDHHQGTVITATSVHSPQGVIVTRAAKEFGMKSIIGFGNAKPVEEMIKKHKVIQTIKNLGGEVIVLSKMGYNNVLYSRLADINKVKNYYTVLFGINLDTDPDAIVNSISHQVENLPDDLDTLVIPTGSGITSGGIIKGVYDRIKDGTMNKKIKIVSLQISGYDRTDTINKIIGTINRFDLNWKEVDDKTYPYSKKVDVKIADNFELDNVYESKAWLWMKNNIDLKNNKTLFWVVGNGNYVRE